MNKLVAQLQGVVGVDAVLSDTNSIAFYTNDIYSKGSDCIAVIRPDNIADLQAIVRLCYQQGVAIFTRGGGVSYTSGYLPNCERSIVIDTVGLNRIVMINETDMYVMKRWLKKVYVHLFGGHFPASLPLLVVLSRNMQLVMVLLCTVGRQTQLSVLT
jgi:hypothetical protein